MTIEFMGSILLTKVPAFVRVPEYDWVPATVGPNPVAVHEVLEVTLAENTTAVPGL